MPRRARFLALVLACGQPRAVEPPSPGEARPPAGFLKGQLHLHSSNSGDSETPPPDVANWYAGRGYDFIVFTDHNRVTTGVVREDLLVIPGVELTFNVQECDPPPEGPLCPLHVNALFVDPNASVAGRPEDLWRATVYRHLVAQARALGGLAQINHPNFHYAADVETIAAVAEGPLLLEVANEAIDSNNGGDAKHPSTFAIWDALLARGIRVWGTATDDAHHYDDAASVRARGELAFEGDRGFVMVRGDADPTVDEVEAAMARGDFYASTGALFHDIECDDGALRVWPRDRSAKLECIAGRPGFSLGAADRVDGRVCLPNPGEHAYVRAEITDAEGRRAWTQPCWAERE